MRILLTFLAVGTALVLVLAGVFIGAYYYVAPSLPEAAELANHAAGVAVGKFGPVAVTRTELLAVL